MHESINIPGLVKRLLDAGESTKSLAARLDVSQPTISRIATGKTRDPSWLLGQRIWLAAGGELIPPPTPAVVNRPPGDAVNECQAPAVQAAQQETRDAA